MSSSGTTGATLDAPGWANTQHLRDFRSRRGLDPQQRVFVVHGTNCSKVRTKLLERGWIENEDTSSRAFDLKWTVRPKRVDGLIGCVASQQIINHFRGAGNLDCKSAMAASLASCAACCDKLFPRQYDLRKALALKAFLEDYLLTAASATVQQQQSEEQQAGNTDELPPPPDAEEEFVAESPEVVSDDGDDEASSSSEDIEDPHGVVDAPCPLPTAVATGDEGSDCADGCQSASAVEPRRVTDDASATGRQPLPEGLPKPPARQTLPRLAPRSIIPGAGYREQQGSLPAKGLRRTESVPRFGRSVAGAPAGSLPQRERKSLVRKFSKETFANVQKPTPEELRLRKMLLRKHASGVLSRAAAMQRPFGSRVAETPEAIESLVRCCHDMEAVTGRSRCVPATLESRLAYYTDCYDATSQSSFSDALATLRSAGDVAQAVASSESTSPPVSCSQCSIHDAADGQPEAIYSAMNPPMAPLPCELLQQPAPQTSTSPAGNVVVGPQHRSFDGPSNAWIVKNMHSSKGRGITVFTDLRSLLDQALQHENKKRGTTWSCVAQKYLERPLTFQGHKVDLRLWVLLTSWYPCVAWVFDQPYFRVASSPLNFQTKAGKGKLHTQAHLTNRTLHGADNRISLDEFFKRVAQEWSWSLEDVQALYRARTWPQMLDGARAALLATQSAAVAEAEDYRWKTKRLDGPRSFELFGFDFALDLDMRPWLLEANCSPDMMPNGPDWVEEWSDKAVDGLLNIVLDSQEGKLRVGPEKQPKGDASETDLSRAPSPPPEADEELPPIEARPLVCLPPDEAHCSQGDGCYGARLASVPEKLVRGLKVDAAEGWLLFLNEAETAPKASSDRARAVQDLCSSWNARVANIRGGPSGQGHVQILREALLPMSKDGASAAPDTASQRASAGQPADAKARLAPLLPSARSRPAARVAVPNFLRQPLVAGHGATLMKRSRSEGPQLFALRGNGGE
eukprot:TRINITY_DN33972_c0_g1_i1.p1 TRINITY_DN33972_c0_g1~~TRINITY_DN33972_c0_g1_i1.p1  ORF type:complete len:968 (-),score=149.29 TRINITY_DN33972_c0_g1_i1:498-3401(-)